MRRLALALTALFGCAPASAPEGLMPTPFGTGAAVKFDVYHRPLPEIPLPNDYATRYDISSPSGLRVNASMIAATQWETGTREGIDQLDGWGTFAPLSVAFTEPLDVNNIIQRHQHDDYDFSDDAVYLVNIQPDSPDFCQPVPLDMGEGNFPLVLENQNFGLTTDTRYRNQQLLFDETNEDLNGNGQLDPGEDTDMDGVLDVGNFAHDTDGPFSVMSFYERETNTLIMKPVLPMRESTVYAAVITKRLTDESGKAVRSPFDYINHTQQTKALTPLKQCLPGLGLSLDDVAFTWSFTTQSVTRDYKAVRDGLAGLGPMSRLQQDYPAKLLNLFRLRRNLPAGENEYILTSDDIHAFAGQVIKAFNGGNTDAPTQAIIDAYKWVDYVVVGQIDSPQFFPRTNWGDGSYHLADDANDATKPNWGTGKLARNDDGSLIDPPLPLYKQIFDLDPVTGAAFTRHETVTFWMSVPKGRNGKPAPVVFLGHGYTSTKLEAVAYMGYFASMGFATIAMDCVSHGLALDGTEVKLAQAEAHQLGYDAFFNALALNDRAVDLDGDGSKDSGADFWTSYTLHTRDVVRQSAIDHMVLARLLKTFDGTRRWDLDVNRDGVKDLAGDFDGDGKVDVGGAASLHFTGGSLGGIMSAMMGGLEPSMETILPVSGGAGLGDVGVRSIQGGVKEAVNWRMFGPVLATQRDPMTHKLQLAEWIPDLNGRAQKLLADFATEPNEGDTAIVTNLDTGEYRCTRVHSDPDFGNALIGAAVSADANNKLKLDIYAGPLPAKTPEGCQVPAGVTPTMTFDTLQYDVNYQGNPPWKAGTPIVAFTDGFGLRRDSPETRRFMSIAQITLEPGDPVNVAPFYEKWLLKYGTGEEVHTRGMIINTIGDMNVPMATGVEIARAAGYIELFQKDPRYGMTDNEVLIQHHALEAVERAGPYRNTQGQPVLMDIDHYSLVAGVDDGFDVPRLDPPLRLQSQSEKLGGWHGMMLPMVVPTGKHGFDPPDPTATWNLGGFMFGTMGRFMQTDGKDFQIQKCSIDFSCSYFPQTVPN
jgi:hypothetical protein